MKFLLISNNPSMVINFRLDLIKDLQKRNIQVFVAAPTLSLDTPDCKKLKSLGVVFHNIALSRSGLNPFKDLVLLFQLIRVMRTIRPHYVLGYTIKPVVWGSVAAFFCRVPVCCSLITGLGYMFSQNDRSYKRKMLTKLAKMLYTMALKNNTHVFFQNPDDQRLFLESKLIHKGVLSTVLKGSGVNLSIFQPTRQPEEAVFIMVGRLLADKGVREFIAASRLVKQEFPSAVFQLVGPFDENPDSISEVTLKSWIEGESVEYLGVLDDVRGALAGASVFVLPSYREGTPRSTLEAMAMGRAIITTDAPGCRETVNNLVNGILVPVKSIEGLVVAMRTLILDPSLRANMGRRSIERARNEFDVVKVNAIMLSKMGVKDVNNNHFL